MKQDFEANAGQLTLLAQVMQAASNPHLKAFAKMLPTLAQDLKDAAPILESLSGDLNDPAVRASLDNMPETIAALMRIQADLSSGSEIMKALQNAAQPETLSTASGIVKRSIKSSNKACSPNTPMRPTRPPPCSGACRHGSTSPRSTAFIRRPRMEWIQM